MFTSRKSFKLCFVVANKLSMDSNIFFMLFIFKNWTTFESNDCCSIYLKSLSTLSNLNLTSLSIFNAPLPNIGSKYNHLGQQIMIEIIYSIYNTLM